MLLQFVKTEQNNDKRIDLNFHSSFFPHSVKLSCSLVYFVADARNKKKIRKTRIVIVAKQNNGSHPPHVSMATTTVLDI